jgi:hypothetical protein
MPTSVKVKLITTRFRLYACEWIINICGMSFMGDFGAPQRRFNRNYQREYGI